MFVTYFFGCWWLPALLSYIDFDIVKLGKTEEGETKFYTKSMAERMQDSLDDEEAALPAVDDAEAESAEAQSEEAAAPSPAEGDNEDASPKTATADEAADEEAAKLTDASAEAEKASGTAVVDEVSDDELDKALRKQASF